MSAIKKYPAVKGAAMFAALFVFMVCAFGACLVAAWLCAKVMFGRDRNGELAKWAIRIGRGLDQTANAGIAGGDPDETLSSRAGKAIYLHYINPVQFAAPAWWMVRIRKVTEKLEPQHVFKAIERGAGYQLSQADVEEAEKLARDGII